MKLNKLLLIVLICSLAITSCKKEDFVKANIDPNVLYQVDPADQFLAASSRVPNDFEYFYDVYKDEMSWMQYTTGPTGNALTFTGVGGNFNYRYGNFYNNIGPALADISVLVSKMSAVEQSKRVYEVNIASILKAYYAFYVSDINGSIPYSQAFQARYGGTLTPVYDPQQNLFDTLDLQIKNAVKTLETPQNAEQALYGVKDPFLDPAVTDEVSHWIKIGNALRLKIAMRLMKRDPAKLKSIATEVLADANQMSAIDDSWVLYVGPQFADAGGNFNPSGLVASKPMINFFTAHTDPRLRIFYRENKDGQYVGSFTNPDSSRLPQYAALYSVQDTLSPVQHRLFTPNYNEGSGAGAGVGFFPLLTYAEYCFIRAELGARSITSDNAATWYANGITASINFYNKRATEAQIDNYTPVTSTEIATYLASPGVTFDATKAIDQIVCQAYIDFYRQPSEAWAWWKRTGYPNTTSVLAWEPLTSNGAPLTLPRRAPLTPLPNTDANYVNQQAAFTDMEKDPNFGSPQDPNGRVWWDAK